MTVIGGKTFIYDPSRYLLTSCCRLMDPLDNPQDIPFLSGLIEREIIYRILRGPAGLAFERSQRWETRVIERQRRLPGSGPITQSGYGWKNSHKWRA